MVNFFREIANLNNFNIFSHIYNLPEGLSASEEVSLMTSPRPVAAASFISGDPFSIVSLKNLKKYFSKSHNSICYFIDKSFANICM